MAQVFDKFDNELKSGDNVCLIAGNCSWRQPPTIKRVKVCGFYTDKNGTGWVLPDPECIPEGIPSKILASRVVKCY